MKSFNNCGKLLLSLLLVGVFLSSLSAQPANDIKQAIELYNRGNVALDNNKEQDALNSFIKSYKLYKHSEIAYAICHVFSLLNRYKETERYADMALNGNPKLSVELENNALGLLEWAKEEQKLSKPSVMSSQSDEVGRRPPNSSNPKRILSNMSKTSKDQQLKGVYTIQQGVYTIQQRSNDRYWDAHEYQQGDFALVTRPLQNNDTQKWIITPLGNNVYTIQQKSNHRYIDAHEYQQGDFALVTRPLQNNDTQKWIITPLGNNLYTIQQKSNHRYVDAYESTNQDYAIVTRTWQNNNTQRWVIKRINIKVSN